MKNGEVSSALSTFPLYLWTDWLKHRHLLWGWRELPTEQLPKPLYLPGGWNCSDLAGRGWGATGACCLMPFSGCHQELQSPSIPGWAYRLVLSATTPQPWRPLQIKDTRSSGGREDPGDGGTQGSPHLHPCWVSRGEVPLCVPWPWARGVGGPCHTVELPRGGPGLSWGPRPSTREAAGQWRGARKRFADFSSSGRLCAEATVAGRSQKDECLLSGWGGGALIKSVALVGTRHILLVAKTHGWICFPFFLNALSRCRLSHIKSENGICSPLYLPT